MVKSFLQSYFKFLKLKLTAYDSKNIMLFFKINRFLICYIGTLLDISTGIIIFAPIFTLIAFFISYAVNCFYNYFYLTKYKNEIQTLDISLKRTIFFSLILLIVYIPLSIASMYGILFIKETITDAVKFNSISNMEKNTTTYNHIGEFSLMGYDNAKINFYIEPNKDEIISKLSYDSEYRFRTYKKLSSEDFWYFMNYKNYVYKGNSDRNLDHLEHENLKSKGYFIFEGIEFVSIATPHKDFITSLDFIKFEDDDFYYVANHSSGYINNYENKYVSLVKQLEKLRNIYSDGFFRVLRKHLTEIVTLF